MRTTITHIDLEQRTFDGRGGGDSLEVNGGTVDLTATAKLVSLTVNGTGALDLLDNAMILDYSGTTSVILSQFQPILVSQMVQPAG